MREFKNGDLVKIVTEGTEPISEMNKRKGTVGRIVGVYLDGTFKVHFVDGDDYWYYIDSDLELYEEE